MIIIPGIHFLFQFNTIKDELSKPDRPAMIVPFFEIIEFPEQVSCAKLMSLNTCLKMTSPAIVYQNGICKTFGKTLSNSFVSPVVCAPQPSEPLILPGPYPYLFSIESATDFIGTNHRAVYYHIPDPVVKGKGFC